MADSNVPDLTDLGATPEDTDVLYIVDDPSGSPLDRKVTVGDLLGDVPRVLATASPSGVSEVDFTLPSGYKIFRLSGWLLPATDSVALNLRCDDGGGFDSTNEYDWAFMFTDGATTSQGAGADTTGIRLGNSDIGSAANEGIEVDLMISRALDAAHTKVQGVVYDVKADGNDVGFSCFGKHEVASALTAIRLVFSSGNIADGELRLIGIP